MKSIITALCLALVLSSQAQYSKYFMPPVDEGLVMTAKEVYAVTLAGDTVKGKVSSATMIGGQIRALNIKSNDGNKYKFKAADITLLAVKATKFMNQTSALSAPNIQRATDMDFDKIMEREWVIFDQALLPNKNKYALMQLLNPDFSSKIKVYVNPNANESGTLAISGVNLTGGEDNSYLVVTQGKQSELYKKRKYDDEALTRLYTDCPEFAEEYAGEKFRWSDFSEHVLVYDRMCD